MSPLNEEVVAGKSSSRSLSEPLPLDEWFSNSSLHRDGHAGHPFLKNANRRSSSLERHHPKSSGGCQAATWEDDGVKKWVVGMSST